ncbi:RNA-binding protein [Candidatus Dependentiae bacterium]|nr:MAG: RNA-binding protein [Candidatus Dependentiae bacterium]
MNIYVGNLSYSTREENLQALFEQFGPVKSVKIIIDKFTGKSKGFGFVEMESEDDAKQAIESLNDTEFEGNRLRISRARQVERRPRPGGPGGGRFR